MSRRTPRENENKDADTILGPKLRGLRVLRGQNSFLLGAALCSLASPRGILSVVASLML